jgi:hypothetical protein
MLIVSWFAKLFPGRATAIDSTGSAASDATGNVATGLLQSAHRLAGQDPHEAERLRGAAQAWLSVVR